MTETPTHPTAALDAVARAAHATGDAHDRREFYWALIQRLAQTAPDALLEAVQEVRP